MQTMLRQLMIRNNHNQKILIKELQTMLSALLKIKLLINDLGHRKPNQGIKGKQIRKINYAMMMMKIQSVM